MSVPNTSKEKEGNAAPRTQVKRRRGMSVPSTSKEKEGNAAPRAQVKKSAPHKGCQRNGLWSMYPRVFTEFLILEISYISYVFLNFVCYSKVATISRK